MFTCSHDLAKSAFLHFDEKIFLLCRWVHFFHFRLYYIYMLKEEILMDKDFVLAEFVRDEIYFNSFIHTQYTHDTHTRSYKLLTHLSGPNLRSLLF